MCDKCAPVPSDIWMATGRLALQKREARTERALAPVVYDGRTGAPLVERPREWLPDAKARKKAIRARERAEAAASAPPTAKAVAKAAKNAKKNAREARITARLDAERQAAKAAPAPAPVPRGGMVAF